MSIGRAASTVAAPNIYSQKKCRLIFGSSFRDDTATGVSFINSADHKIDWNIIFQKGRDARLAIAHIRNNNETIYSLVRACSDIFKQMSYNILANIVRLLHSYYGLV